VGPIHISLVVCVLEDLLGSVLVQRRQICSFDDFFHVMTHKRCNYCKVEFQLSLLHNLQDFEVVQSSTVANIFPPCMEFYYKNSPSISIYTRVTKAMQSGVSQQCLKVSQ